ncbi:MAG: hypothetical protein ISR83_03585 [Candidatus Marinimicrobia bacterium]|nr:hypothetical protein [Candidatus Neomarinimicrobiota bacterium]
MNTSNDDSPKMISLAKGFSLLLHPMLLSFFVYIYFIFFHLNIKSNPWVLTSISFLFLNLLPIATVIYLKYTGKISDLDASNREQRMFPLILGVIYAALGFSSLFTLDAPPLIQGLMFCFMTNTLFTLMVTRYWKISIHAMGVTGPMAALWISGIHAPIIMGLFVIIISISRIILKAHTIAQVTVGSIAGFVLTYLQLRFIFSI